MKMQFYVLLILPSLFSLASHSQLIDTGEEAPCRSVRKTAMYVAQSEPRISQETLDRDLGTIRATQTRMKEYYAKHGINNDCAADAATALAWKDIRASQPAGRLEEQALFKLASEGFGGIRILSIPAGASIKVDGKPWDRRTNTEGWTHAGRRKITLSMAGYEDLDGEKVVEPANVVEYKGKLVKKQR